MPEEPKKDPEQEQEPTGIAALHSFLRNFHYKPYWRFIADVQEPMPVAGLLRSSFPSMGMIEVEYLVQDANSSKGSPVPVIRQRARFPLPDIELIEKSHPPITEAEWEEYILRVIAHIEIHEIGEFFAVGNRRPYNPHDPAAKRLSHILSIPPPQLRIRPDLGSLWP